MQVIVHGRYILSEYYSVGLQEFLYEFVFAYPMINKLNYVV